MLKCVTFLSVAVYFVSALTTRRCTFRDDPHMYSFDSTPFDYHATCEFIYTQPCTSTSLPADIPNFEVYGQNGKSCPTCNSRFSPAYSKTIGLRITNSFGQVTDIRLQRENTSSQTIDVYLNGAQLFFLPAFPLDLGNGNSVEIFADPTMSTRKVIETNFGLKIYLQPGSGAIELDSDLATDTQEALCGACGQHNGISGDNDFTWADGTQINRIKQTHFYFVPQNYYTPYVTANNPAGCVLDPRFDITENDTTYLGVGSRKRRDARPVECEGRRLRGAQKYCSIITRRNGPFSACLDDLDAEIAFQSCVTDLCISEEFACPTLEGYAATCGEFGQLGNWRQQARCPLECGENEFYSTVASPACIPTCEDPTPCPKFRPNQGGQRVPGGVFDEGCLCKPGFVHDGKGCVSQSACGDVELRSVGGRCAGLHGRRRAKCLRKYSSK